ncbi:MAG: response regulator transcription factor [Candidatus Promineifilaceae bacterium]|nr:response regulator transcription factor [Candidatus Promineifilaceae bacterium]
MAKRTVLVVDDEANIRELARLYLERNDFRVLTAESGDQALKLVERERPDLMVLDLMLPGVDGWEVCRRVRAGSDVPILMLTARDDDVDKIVGLELGADDYMTKPFNPRELVARVRAILRRSGPPGPGGAAPRQVADVVVDPAARQVTVAERVVSLRPKEFDLLLALVDHLNLVLTREQLLDQVWGYEYYGATRTVDVHVAQLRDKLADSGLQIETIWGIGYKLVEK